VTGAVLKQLKKPVLAKARSASYITKKMIRGIVSIGDSAQEISGPMRIITLSNPIFHYQDKKMLHKKI
jgi:hypothetical protein